MSTIDELRGLVERATKGPWVEREALKATAGGIKTVRDIFSADGDRVLLNLSEADRLLIVAAVNALPLLLEVVAEARYLNEETFELLDGEDLCNTAYSVRRLIAALARLDEGVRHG